MASPYRTLRITDGTTDTSGQLVEVDLLSYRNGFNLTNWEVGISEPKGGGVWSDSALSDGRQPQLAKAGNTIQTMTLEVTGFDTDHLAQQTQTLRQLLRQARQYWMTRWATRPVYLVRQAVNESNPSYLEIKGWTTPTGAGVNENNLWQRILSAGISDFDLVLECGPYWRDIAPGENGSCLEIGAMQAWESTYFGNYDFNSSTREQTCAADTVYIANKHNIAQLTDVYWFDASGPAYSANLLTTSLTYNLLPAATSVSDMIYIGIDSTVANAGPFCSLVFDLESAGSGLSFSNSGGTQFWQYCDGLNWIWLDTQDNTNAAGAGTGEPLDTAGPGSVHWNQPNAWSFTTINGVTGYWVRAIVNSVAAPSPPVQQNRQPYTIVTPFVEIRSDKVGGDVPSLARLQLRNQSSDPGGTRSLFTDRWVIGLRSLSRGADFTAYLNASDEQNPTGITFSTGTYTTLVLDTRMPTGRRAIYNPGVIVTDWTTEAYWVLDSTICNQYFGTFHAFLRVKKQSNTSVRSIGARMYCTALDTLGASDSVYSSKVAYIQAQLAAADPELLDLGRITAPPGQVLSTDETNGLRFYVELINSELADAMDIYELILMPVDEMSIDTYELESSGAATMNLDYTMLLDLDSVSIPKFPKRSVRRVTSSDRIFGSYAVLGSDELVIQAHANQRLWFLSEYYQTLAGYRVPEFEQAHSVQMWNVQRYYNLRGDQ